MSMRNADGRFAKGCHSSPETEFKPGEHWRQRKPYWDRAWLDNEYTTKQRSARDIADEFGVGETAIAYWLTKHQITTRTTSEARAVKSWAARGPANGMYGRTGSANPRWKGGISPERQRLYASAEWASVSAYVWRRDAETCTRCGVVSHDRRRMYIHHIEGFDERPDLRTDPDNLCLLCTRCHADEHKAAKRGDAK